MSHNRRAGQKEAVRMPERNKAAIESIRHSFARQAETMSNSPIFSAKDGPGTVAQASGHGPGRRCIDVGCGPGIVLEVLARRGGEVVGVDATPEMVQRAQERCRRANLDNVEVLAGLCESLPFPDRHFDAVVSRTVLHHVADPHTVMAEMARVLRPGGRMVVVDVVSSDASEESDLQNALEIMRDPSHVRMLGRSEFQRLGQPLGLRLIEQRHWVQHRDLGEWLRIVSAPEREWPLGVVMRNLAEAGRHAGINITCAGNTITFDHSLLMLVLDKAG
jgi:ubiquinone/menaquinone biosynthesis C-methylase UbiE